MKVFTSLARSQRLPTLAVGGWLRGVLSFWRVDRDSTADKAEEPMWVLRW